MSDLNHIFTPCISPHQFNFAPLRFVPWAIGARTAVTVFAFATVSPNHCCCSNFRRRIH
jgi:hypothetical protein